MSARAGDCTLSPDFVEVEQTHDFPPTMEVPFPEDGGAMSLIDGMVGNRLVVTVVTPPEGGGRTGLIAVAVSRPPNEPEDGVSDLCLYVPINAQLLRALAVQCLSAADAIDGGSGKQ